MPQHDAARVGHVLTAFAGFQNVTAAERAAAARALGITVPAWREGQHVYFDLAARGSIDSNPCARAL